MCAKCYYIVLALPLNWLIRLLVQCGYVHEGTFLVYLSSRFFVINLSKYLGQIEFINTPMITRRHKDGRTATVDLAVTGKLLVGVTLPFIVRGASKNGLENHRCARHYNWSIYGSFHVKALGLSLECWWFAVTVYCCKGGWGSGFWVFQNLTRWGHSLAANAPWTSKMMGNHRKKRYRRWPAKMFGGSLFIEIFLVRFYEQVYVCEQLFQWWTTISMPRRNVITQIPSTRWRKKI